MFQQRVARLQSLMKAQDLEVLALVPGASLFYLTGLSFHLMERPTIAFVQSEGNPILMLPSLEAAKAKTSPLALELITYEDEEVSRKQAYQAAAQALDLQSGQIGMEPLSMRAFELHILHEIIPHLRLKPAADLLTALRLYKDAHEIVHMRQAVRVAETALKTTLASFRIGMSEEAMASELVIQLLRAGSASELPFQPIVASGPNSALPHATPTSRKIQKGDLLIIDYGARVQGYVSDITRTFAIGEIQGDWQAVYDVVLAANAAGRAAVRPGMTCAQIDQITRRVIVDGKLGEYFIHRTGHGIGLEGHEDPSVQGDNGCALEPGMTFTIEPGVYIPGRGGIRIEDNVAVTDTACEVLTTLPRELEVIG